MPLTRRKLVETPDLGGTAPAAVPTAGYAFTPYFREGVWYYKDDTNTEYLVAPAFYAAFEDTTGGNAIGTGVGAQAINALDATNVADTNYTLVAGEIQFNSNGTYEVDYTAATTSPNTTGGNRATITTRLLLDNTLIPGSQSDVYIREQTGLEISASGGALFTATSGQTLGIYTYRSFGTSTATTFGRTAIKIKRVK